MANLRNWTFSHNLTPTSQDTLQHQAQSLWWQLSQFLLANGWTTEQSNAWTSASALAWNSSTLARSWITLKSPEGCVAGADGSYLGAQSRIYLTIALTSSTTTQYWNALISMCNASASLSTGTTTTPPTNATEVFVNNSSSFLQYLAATPSVSKFHFAIAAGENVSGVLKGAGQFIVYVTNALNSGVCTMFSLLPLTSIQKLADNSDYKYGAALAYQYNATQATTIKVTSFIVLTGWNNDGTANGANLTACYFFNGATTYIGANETNVAPAIDGNISLSEYWVYNSTPNKCLPVAKIADIKFTGASVPNFTVDSATPTTCAISNNSTFALYTPSNVVMVY